MANTVIYGDLNLTDLFAGRVTDGGNAEVMMEAVMMARDYHQRVTDDAIGVLAANTTVEQETVALPGAIEYEPLSPESMPTPVVKTDNYQTGYPIKEAGTGFGENYVVRAKLTDGEMARRMADAMLADSRWRQGQMLASIYTNTSSGWAFSDAGFPNMANVQGFANGDTVVYLRRDGTIATDDHYLAQANTIGNSADNPFPTIYSELSEHPSNMVSRDMPVIVYTPSNLVSSIEALTNFREAEDGLTRYGTGSDIMLESVRPLVPFGEILGVVDKCVVVELEFLPDSYLIAHASGAGPVLKYRQEPQASLQGWIVQFSDVDGNNMRTSFRRRGGFGVYNRIGGLVYRIGNGTYAIPTGYNNASRP